MTGNSRSARRLGLVLAELLIPALLFAQAWELLNVR